MSDWCHNRAIQKYTLRQKARLYSKRIIVKLTASVGMRWQNPFEAKILRAGERSSSSRDNAGSGGTAPISLIHVENWSAHRRRDDGHLASYHFTSRRARDATNTNTPLWCGQC